jgi:hypothetical protein
MNLSSNWIAICALAACHETGGFFLRAWNVTQHRPDELAEGLFTGKMAAHSYRLAHLSIKTLDRIGGVEDFSKLGAKAKNGITCSQLRRQLCAMVGYFSTQGPWSISSSRSRDATADSAWYTGLSAAATARRSFHEAKFID